MAKHVLIEFKQSPAKVQPDLFYEALCCALCCNEQRHSPQWSEQTESKSCLIDLRLAGRMEIRPRTPPLTDMDSHLLGSSPPLIEQPRGAALWGRLRPGRSALRREHKTCSLLENDTFNPQMYKPSCLHFVLRILSINVDLWIETALCTKNVLLFYCSKVYLAEVFF